MGGAVLLAGIVAAVGYRSIAGPDELTMRQYSRQLCEDVLEPAAKRTEDIVDSRDYDRLLDADIRRESQAADALSAGGDLLAVQEETVRQIAGFNDSRILKGSDGEDFRVEMQEATDEWLADHRAVMRDIAEIDPADEEDVAEDFFDASEGVDGLDVDLDEDEPGGELLDRLYDDEEECGQLFASMVGEQRGSLVRGGAQTREVTVPEGEETVWVPLEMSSDRSYTISISWPEATDVDAALFLDGEEHTSDTRTESGTDNNVTLYGIGAADVGLELRNYGPEIANVTVELSEES